ncbi:MAG: FG-GAP-like repeat-containing protein, partial [Candidatus Cloacimonadota bacterium]
YENLGDGMFENINAGMFPVFYGAAAWGDYDNDQFPDIVCQGYTLSGPITKLYRNNQEGGFQEVPTRLQNCYGGSLTWGDYNSDGKLDLFLTGYFDGNRISKIYRNENWGIFSITGDEFPNISSSWATWTDYNNDGKLDLFLAGFDGNLFHSRLYRNDYPHINTQPSPPIITYNTDSQRFQISGSEDSTTPESGLTYDIRIGTVPGGCDGSAPLAHPDGSRMIDKLGRRVIRFIPEEGQIYYAAVQAIDRSFARSAFSSEIAFSVEGEAQICTIGPPLYDYGSVYLDNSIQHSVIVGNPGTGNLYVNSIELVSGTNFSIDPIDTPLILAIGATYSIRVTFCPQSNGILTDSLVIMSNAVNSPLLQIPLLGCGISSPPAPVQDITLEMIGNDAHLSWSPVTETTTGEPIEVSRYVIFFNQNSDEEHFWYLANTTDLSYVHEDVGLFSPSWFYRIVAVVLYSRADELWMDHLERGTKPFALKDFPALRFKKGSDLLRKGLPTTHLKK